MVFLLLVDLLLTVFDQSVFVLQNRAARMAAACVETVSSRSNIG
jgi:hypothetical protein